MLVQLYDVRVPAPTTRFLQVPEYEVPLIKDSWKGPGGLSREQETRYHIEPMGKFVARPLGPEMMRLKSTYNGESGTSGGVSVFRAIYPTDASFHDAWERAVESSAKAKAEMEKATKPKSDPKA